MPPFAFSAFLADASLKMTPSELSRGPSLESFAAANERISRAVVFRLADALPRAAWIVPNTSTDVIIYEVFISV